MTSILTNTSSMIALQTLKGINSSLESVQSEISTGKSVASAKDNSAVWAISKVMESDVAGFEAISDSLSLGESTVAVAANAAETVTDLLTQMKEKIVAAQEDNVDRDKIQTDIDALKDQIGAVVGAAQFNGLNLVNGSNSSVDVLSSLDRDSNGNVSASNITVAGQDLSLENGTALTGAGVPALTAATAAVGASTNIIAANAFQMIDTDGTALTTANSVGVGAISETGLDNPNITPVDTGLMAGDVVTLTFGDTSSAGVEENVDYFTVSYTVKEGDFGESINAGLAAAFNEKVGDPALENFGKNAVVATTLDASDLSATATAGVFAIDNANAADTLAVAITAERGSGGLSDLNTLDVTTNAGAESALSSIEKMIDTSVDAAAAFGSVQGRIETQADFIAKLSDSMTAGIGTLVDADMEEASARLQALQVQQQLGVQALSIANSSPQSVLSLFQ
ncbi:flagellin [Aliiruegeria sabulilitoris]|uniref:flagellin n=1 Tax=Aliiruegeria sabulilitoris TaxID=1510458 RepID=UPI000833AEDE|nr:flagellin [Aliiruegeria sabulilitoris]NDR57886.1 flagellin [Pseudoruegeria sp. M32A2M]